MDELIPGEMSVAWLSFKNHLAHDGSGLRGFIIEMNKFENKLRIVGWFTQIIK